MANLIIPRKEIWTRQPPSQTDLALPNKQIVVMPGVSMRSFDPAHLLITKMFGATRGFTNGPWGRGFNIWASGVDYFYTPQLPYPIDYGSALTPKPFCYVTAFVMKSFATSGRHVHTGRGSSISVAVACYSATARLSLLHGITTSDTPRISSESALLIGKPYCVVVGYSAVDGWFMWVNGSKHNSVDSSTPWVNEATSALDTYVNFGRYSDSSRVPDKETYLDALIEGEVEDKRAISVSPWLLFKPQQKRVFISLGGGGEGVTINTTPALAVASGLQAKVSTDVSIVTSIANALASGLTSLVSSDITVSCTPAAGTVSGLQAKVTSDITVSAGVGAGIASGVTATITASADSILCTPAFGVATGRAAGVSTAVEIDASIGSCAGFGLQASISTAQSISCAVASASASGLNTKVSSNITIACGYAHGSGYGLPASITIEEDIPLTEAQLDQALAYIKSDPMILTIPKYIALRDMLNS